MKILDVRRNPAVDQLLVLLILADVLLIVIHLLRWETIYYQANHFAITREGSIGELFQYLKEFWLGALFMYAGIKRTNPMLIAWSLVFFYFLADDSLKWHEEMGLVVARLIDLPWMFGLHPEFQGQVVYALGLATVFFSIIGLLAWLRSREAVLFSVRMFVLLGGLAFFAVVIDWIYHLFDDKWIRHYIASVEEGGEMIVLSFILWFVMTSLQETKSDS
jgi:hypothetical protein